MIVGLYSDVPQSGKSTVSQQFMNADYRKLSLATTVKKSLYVVLMALDVPNAEEYLWGNMKDEVIPELGVTGGYLMSTYATDFFRNMIDENVWLNIIKKQYRPGEKWVVDDMRFPNEFDFIKSVGGRCIRIVRPSQISALGRSEKSEGQLSGHHFDWVILNGGTLQDLQLSVQSIITTIERGWKERCGC
jgi:hypothetical protein